MNRCPACRWPLGNRSFAPPSGTAVCVKDKYDAEGITWLLVLDLTGQFGPPPVASMEARLDAMWPSGPPSTVEART